MAGSELLERVFGTPRPVVGVVHLLALPGSPGFGGMFDEVLERAVSDVRALARGGCDGAVVENYGDRPFLPGSVGPETVAALAVAVRACAGEVSIPLGVNCLRNDPVSALACCVAGGASFLRTNLLTGVTVTDQGLLQGRAHDLLRERARLGAGHVAILADVLVKHGSPLGERDPRRHAMDTVERGGADGLLVTGAATGRRADFRQVAVVRDACPDTPLLVASGVVPADLPLIATLADGVLVGSALEKDGRAGNAVELARVRRLVKAARRAFRR